MSSDISKAEFLKRYLEDDKQKEKKRKSIISGLKIVHVDIDNKAIPFGEKADEEVGDDAPVIAEVIDERPLEAQLEEQYEKSKWKKLTYDEKSRPVKTLSGLKAGLQNAATLKQETQELRERERKQINKHHDDNISGRNAETIIRDPKTGKKRDIEAENRVKEGKESKKAEQQEKYSKWGKGFTKISEDLYEVSNKDLEEMLKSVIYDDDPMSAYMKKKKQKTAGPSMRVYSGPPPPPCRFTIPPGYRWDGVDRSNGFEKYYLEKHNSSKAIQEEVYLWSVQNM